MSIYTLKVPSTQQEKDWFRFIRESLSHIEGVSELVVDFNDVKFMDTHEFVMLACLIESFYINSSVVSFKGGADGFNNHLYNIKFKKYWKEGFNRNKFTISLKESTLCLWKISEEMIYSYSTYARSYFERFASNKDLTPLASNMDEVFNNIFDHANSSVTGYIITQYYPKNNTISFSICDFGIGIPVSLKEAGIIKGSNLQDCRVILKSLERGVSVHSTPQNRGFGLNNLLDFTVSSESSLLIISNDGKVEKTADGRYLLEDTDFDFKGTLVKVEVSLNGLEEKDCTEEILDF